MATRQIAVGFALATLLAVGGGCSEHRMRDMRQRSDRGTTASRESALDLNSASRAQLAALPGLSDDDAQRIVDHRPYDSKRQLLQKQVIGKGKYDKIEDYVFVSRDR